MPLPTSCERIGLLVATVYSVGITCRYVQWQFELNPICERDFVTTAQRGTCLCGENEYCLCGPSLAADVIIELEDDAGIAHSVVFVERRDGRGLAMVGGFVKVGESADVAVAREALEETGLTLRSWRQWCMFSKPDRDPRRHTAANVYIGRARGTPHAADDAKGIRVVPLDELRSSPPKFAFDHGSIIDAYLASSNSARPAGAAHEYAAHCQSASAGGHAHGHGAARPGRRNLLRRAT